MFEMFRSMMSFWTGAARVLAVLLVLPACAAGCSAPDLTRDAGAAGGDEEHLSPVVAEVNGEPLYRAFYEQNLNYIRTQISKNQASADVERYLRAEAEAFQLLIQDELLYQEARRQGLAATDELVQREFERLAREAGGEGILLAGHRARGMSRRDTFDGIRRRLSVDRYVAEKLIAGLSVSDEETKQHYEEHLDQFSPELWIKTQHILIRCPRDADEARVRAARQRTAKILENVLAGSDFGEMAREFSEDPSSAVLGGHLGLIRKGYMDPEFDAVAFMLAPGEVSDVVRTDAGFHLILVTETKGGKPLEFENVQEQCRKAVLAKKQKDAVLDEVESLARTATIVSHLE